MREFPSQTLMWTRYTCVTKEAYDGLTLSKMLSRWTLPKGLVAIKATLAHIQLEDSSRLQSEVQGLAEQQRKALDGFDEAEKEVVDA